MPKLLTKILNRRKKAVVKTWGNCESFPWDYSFKRRFKINDCVVLPSGSDGIIVAGGYRVLTGRIVWWIDIGGSYGTHAFEDELLKY